MGPEIMGPEIKRFVQLGRGDDARAVTFHAARQTNCDPELDGDQVVQSTGRVG
jgi:hypothetical protein